MAAVGNRLLMLVPSVGSAFGEQVEVLAKHLRDYGVRVFLVVPGHYYEERPRHPDDWVIKTTGSKLVAAIRLLSPLMLWSLTRYLFRVMPRWVYVYCGEAYPPAMLVLLLCRLLRIKSVLSIHDAVPHPGKFFDFALGTLRLPSLHLTSVLHTFSEHARDILERRFPHKHVIASPLLDLAELYLRYPAIRNVARELVLCFGRIEPYKDIPCVVAAFTGLRRNHPSAMLRIVGKNGLGRELFSITKGVPNCQIINKFLPPFALAEELSAAQVCIFAYSEASHSGGAELALAFGCNVVATRVPAFNGIAGLPGVFLFEPGNAQDCTEALARAVNTPKRSRDRNALERVVSSNQERARLFLHQAQVVDVANFV